MFSVQAFVSRRLIRRGEWLSQHDLAVQVKEGGNVSGCH
jgi:hypothetical protein